MTASLFDMGRSAVLSPCRRYRYVLKRQLRPIGGSICNFVMLNPSTADETKDDPTLKRCIRFARDWGYHELVITNLFALRSTDPRALRTADDPIGPENDGHLIEQAGAANLIVCAWGVWGALNDRGDIVRRLLAKRGNVLHYLTILSGNHPGHPLRLPAHLTPELWEI